MKLCITEYNRVHKWAERNLSKTGICFYCGEHKHTQWSNIDHQYRLIPEEWQEVCVKCHMSYDKEVLGVDFGKKNGLPMPHKHSKARRELIDRLQTYAWVSTDDLAKVL